MTPSRRRGRQLLHRTKGIQTRADAGNFPGCSVRSGRTLGATNSSGAVDRASEGLGVWVRLLLAACTFWLTLPLVPEQCSPSRLARETSCKPIRDGREEARKLTPSVQIRASTRRAQARLGDPKRGLALDQRLCARGNESGRQAAGPCVDLRRRTQLWVVRPVLVRPDRVDS